MDLRHPVESMQTAWQRALGEDLVGVQSELADAVLGASAAGPVSRRPLAQECSVAMFSQAWLAAELGMTYGPKAAETVDAETVVITGPAGDVCVYAAGRLLYHLDQPNRRFFLDLSGQQLRGVAHRSTYDGRDSADLEAFDYEVATALARLRAASQHADAGARACMVRQLRALLNDLSSDGRRTS
jgi:hypothetical protein